MSKYRIDVIDKYRKFSVFHVTPDHAGGHPDPYYRLEVFESSPVGDPVFGRSSTRTAITEAEWREYADLCPDLKPLEEMYPVPGGGQNSDFCMGYLLALAKP